MAGSETDANEKRPAKTLTFADLQKQEREEAEKHANQLFNRESGLAG